MAEGVVSFDLEKQKSFNQGQIHVALSRISSMNKMYLIESYKKAALKLNESAKIEYERLRSESLFKSQSHLAVTETSVTITLLSICSLKLHVWDITVDDRLLYNDILYLTETQYEAGSDTSIIESALLKNYIMQFNSSDNKFKGIAYGLSYGVEILAKEDFNRISIFNILKQHFSNNPFSIALIYRYPDTQTPAFIDCLNYVVGSGIDVLLGDLNIDVLDEVAYRKMRDTLSSYNVKVLEPTHLDGALLNHVYFHKTFEHDKLVMSVAKLY